MIMVVNHRIMFINHDPFFKPLKRITRGFLLKYIKHMCTHHQATNTIPAREGRKEFGGASTQN